MARSIFGARKVLDLACGPGTQLLLLAELFPDTQFVGADLSPRMLEAAENNRRQCGLKNVEFQKADITKLHQFKGCGFDAVISTMALHHLPKAEDLRLCAEQICSVLEADRRIYLADILRPRRMQTVDFMAKRSANTQPKMFNDDFRNSMIAGFQKSDFHDLTRIFLPDCETYTTWPVRLFVIIRTRPVSLPAALTSRLAEIRASEPPRVIEELDELRKFFRLGGLPDPFGV
jgi:SAM-dependent methyltransferase